MHVNGFPCGQRCPHSLERSHGKSQLNQYKCCEVLILSSISIFNFEVVNIVRLSGLVVFMQSMLLWCDKSYNLIMTFCMGDFFHLLLLNALIQISLNCYWWQMKSLAIFLIHAFAITGIIYLRYMVCSLLELSCE